MHRIRPILMIALLAATMISCKKDEPDEGTNTGFRHGVFIVNEGAYGNSNGSLSYFDKDSSKMINHLFESVNGRPLGDVVQSFATAGDKGFIVVNNSGKVEVVDLKTFQSLGSIEGLQYPRYFIPVDDKKGYLTDGNFTGRVYVIDLESIKITDTVATGNGPEKMLLLGDRVFVANSGGWGNDSTLTVIDRKSGQVIASPRVGMDPADLVLDSSGKIWILCKGKVVWNPDFTLAEETSSSLVVFDPQTLQVIRSYPIGTTGDYYWPQHIGISGDGMQVYYLEAEGIYRMNVNDAGTPVSPFIRRALYGFGTDPETHQIYALSAPSFTSAGTLYRYASDGVIQDSLEVGIGPSQVVFN